MSSIEVARQPKIENKRLPEILNKETIKEIWLRLNENIGVTAERLAKRATPGKNQYDITGKKPPGGKMSNQAGLKGRYYNVSAHEFGQAIDEFNTDLAFIQARRELVNGISPGKVLGALVFRLCRHRVVSLEASSRDYAGLENFLEIAVLALAFEYLEINLEDKWIVKKRKLGAPKHGSVNDMFKKMDGLGKRERYIEHTYSELVYLMKRRHYNQESLAVLFDALCIVDEAIKEIHVSGATSK